jgi:hypothetical protein
MTLAPRNSETSAKSPAHATPLAPLLTNRGHHGLILYGRTIAAGATRIGSAKRPGRYAIRAL